MSCFIGCSSSTDEPNTPDAPEACALEPQISRTKFVDESVAYLRSAYGTTTGFEGGTITYGETAVPLTDGPCPVADWTGLTYTVSADPSQIPIELRATHDRVAAMWWLNGRKAVGFVPTTIPQNEFDQWLYGHLPDNFNILVANGADLEEVQDMLDEVRAAQPALTIDYLEAIGVVTVTTGLGDFTDQPIGPVTVPMMDAIAQRFRDSELFLEPEWTGAILRIPNDSWAGVTLTGDTLAPECEREKTIDRRASGVFTTEPSFAAPLGAGIKSKTPTCE